MTTHPKARRRDDNEAALIREAHAFAKKRKLHIGVQIIAETGVPDLLLGILGRNAFAEVKNPEGNSPAQKTLTPDQRAWWKRWPGQKAIVETPLDMRRLILAHEAEARILNLAPVVADLADHLLKGGRITLASKLSPLPLPVDKLREFVAWTRALQEKTP